MSSDDVRLLEIRSRSIEQQLRIQRVEIARISDSLRQSDTRLGAVTTQFKQVRSQLLAASEPSQQKSPVEKLAETRVYAQKLNQLTATIQKETQQSKILLEKKQSANQALAAGTRQMEKVSAHLEAAGRKNTAISEEKMDSELEDVTTSHQAAERKETTGAKTLLHEFAGQSHEHGASGDSPREDRTHNHGSGFSLVTSDSTPMAQATPQNFESATPSATRTFRQALSNQMQNRVLNLAKWEQLDRTGVEFRVDLGLGKTVGVEIDSHATGGMSVRLQSESKTEGRQLRKDRHKIITELSNAGCQVKAVSVVTSCK